MYKTIQMQLRNQTRSFIGFIWIKTSLQSLGPVNMSKKAPAVCKFAPQNVIICRKSGYLANFLLYFTNLKI